MPPADQHLDRSTVEVHEDGAFGGWWVVNDEIMQEVFNAALKDVLTVLEFEET